MSPSVRAKVSLGSAPAASSLRWTPCSVCRATHWIRWASVMGWATEPTVTVTVLPSTATTGLCFSPAASTVLGTSSFMGSPQQIIGTPEL